MSRLITRASLRRIVAIAGAVIGGLGCGTFFSTPTPIPTPTPTPVLLMETLPEECLPPEVCAIFGEGDSIKIGVAGPMTGDNRAFGIDAYQAAEIAVADAGTIEGFSIALVKGDDEGTGEGGAIVGAEFAADQDIVAVMGHCFSGASSNAMPIYADNYIPMMTGSATRIDLSQVENPSFNRLVSTDLGQAIFIAGFLADNLGAKNIAIIHDGTAYGQEIGEIVGAMLTDNGMTVAGTVPIEPGNAEYPTELEQIAAMQPDALFFGGFQPEAAVIAKNMNDMDLDIPLVAGDGVFGNQFLDLARSDGDGVYVSWVGAPISPAREAFDKAYEARFDQEAGSLSGYTWFYYDATMVLIKAIKEVAIESEGKLYIPRKALVDAVRNTRGYEGLTGTVTCDKDGECTPEPTFVMYQANDRVFEQLEADYRP